MLMTTVALAFAIQVAAPAKTASVELKGEPTRLSWSTDGAQLAIQTSERDDKGMTKNPRFYLVAAGDGKLSTTQASPEWADKYWEWKSNQFTPWAPSLAIDVKQDQKTVSSTSTPMGGSLAKGGTSGDPSSGTTADEAVQHKLGSQTLNVVTLTLLGETVGYFEGVQFIPGYTFGWAPKDLAAIAYVTQGGRLAVMDKDGKKQQVDGTKGVILPAWSVDGTKIAFLQKTGKNKYDLYVAPVTR
jgi:hypothetical protein